MRRIEKKQAPPPPINSFASLILLDKVRPDEVTPLLEALGGRDGADVHRDEVEARGVELEREEVGPHLLLKSCCCDGGCEMV